MENIDPNEIKDILSDRWGEWAVMFTNTNRGRLVNIEINDKELGLKTLAENYELVAVDYDPEGKGNNIVVSYGSQESPESHLINNPVKITQMQNSNGLVASIVIEDNDGMRNEILFK